MLANQFNALTEENCKELLKEIRKMRGSSTVLDENIAKFVDNCDLRDYCKILVIENVNIYNLFLSGFFLGVEFADKLMEKNLEKEFKRKL